MRQAISSASGSLPAARAASFATPTTFGTSPGASQLIMTPSAFAPASASILSRSAPTKIGGGCAGRRESRKPFTRTDSPSTATFSPANACLRNSSVSRIRPSGRRRGTPFHLSTIAGELVPSPRQNRPGAASATAAASIASSAGPRVNTLAMALPSRSSLVQDAASASGTKASVPSTSAVQASVYPSRSASWSTSRCSRRGTPSRGNVMPQRSVIPPTSGSVGGEEGPDSKSLSALADRP